MDTAVTAWLQAELGKTTDLTDLATRYTRLGTARAVALEVLRERLAALRSQPSTVNVSSVVAVSYTENIKAYERQIAALEAGEPPAPDDPDDGTGISSDLNVLYLVERPRR
ncbi:hypothetical protein ACFV0T_26125 [Streptomyces sp. NPDC059582]|uniref:hypothetical protein n=1 Tax=Streptomyces sp. NPDC059582 TaxID=3346875 RepID=UPI0036C8C08E